ncbi:DUF2993 domain-containing protein [Corynebacterium sp. L4756]|uniref:LmeA family phospholipid-binding protein n=1 Tax=unclassified Corynebacterium TaxID=2624378 RepID=UPI00374CB2B0
MAKTKSAGSTAWKIIVGILVTLLIIVLLAEFGMRWFTAKQMKDQFHASAQEDGIEVSEEPSVSFGSSPLIFGMLSGEIPQLDMHTPSTLQINGDVITGQPETEVSMEGMTLSEDPVARSLTATTTIPDDYLLITFQDAIASQSGVDILRDVVVTDITANAEGGVLEFQLGGGLATISLKPTAVDGQMNLEATDSTLFGVSLPEQATQSISDALSQGMADQFTGDLAVQDIVIGDGTIALTVHGENVNFNELNQQMGQTTDAVQDPAPSS